FYINRTDFFWFFLFFCSVLGLVFFLLSILCTIRWWLLIIFIVVGIWFYNFDQRKKDPFIDVNSLRLNKNIKIVYGVFMLINFVYYNYFFGLPTLLQQVRGYSESNTGLIMLALAGVSVIVTPIAGRLIDKRGSKPDVRVR